jgi:hypothetical protein
MTERPPFIPTVHGSDDTSNFDDFEKVKSVKFTTSPLTRQFGFNGKELPFVGFTFSKLFSSSNSSSSRASESQLVKLSTCLILSYSVVYSAMIFMDLLVWWLLGHFVSNSEICQQHEQCMLIT